MKYVSLVVGALIASAISMAFHGRFNGMSAIDVAEGLALGVIGMAGFLALFSPLLLLRVIDRHRIRRRSDKAADTALQVRRP